MGETIVHSAPELSLGNSSDSDWERERAAFWALFPSLKLENPGEYVAIHGGQIVAHGPEEIAVAQEAYSRVGYVPIYVGFVTDSPPRPARIPSPRLLHGPAADLG